MTPARAAVTFLVLLAGAILGPCTAFSQQIQGGLFATPFVVEHSVIITEPDGSTYVGDPVSDHYGGSMIVSVRQDGSRLIIDFARREITEVRPSTGTYTVITFDRMAQLMREYQQLEGPPPEPKSDVEAPAVELRVTEVAPEANPKLATSTALRTGTTKLLEKSKIRRLEVAMIENGKPGEKPVVEIWLDRSLRFGAGALDAVEDFEIEVLGATASDNALVPLKAVAAARRYADGALPVATARAEGSGSGRVEDVATRVEKLDALPTDLMTVPEGLDRAAHPLELMLAHAERERELRQLMSVPESQGGGR